MDLTQFRSFKELISTPVSENEYNQVIQMIEEIYNTSFQNQVWMGVILEFLNEIDVLIDGPFILSKKSFDVMFRGSKNQRVIDVKKTFVQEDKSKPILYNDKYSL